MPNMGILVRYVNRYLSLIESAFAGRAPWGRSEKTVRFIGLPA